MIYNIINFILFIVSIIVIVLSTYPLNIYELISKSKIYDIDRSLYKKFKWPIIKQFRIFRSNIILKDEGIMDIKNNVAEFNIKGNITKLDIERDFDKIIPMIV